MRFSGTLRILGAADAEPYPDAEKVEIMKDVSPEKGGACIEVSKSLGRKGRLSLKLEAKE